MPGVGDPCFAGQQVERLIQPGLDLLHRQRDGTRGGQLDGKRQPLQPFGDAPHRLSRQRHPRVHSLGAGGEQLRGRIGGQPVQRQHPLARSLQRPPAGHQHAQARAAGGCFFVSAAAEFGSRPGPVREEVAAAQRDWTGLLRAVAARARQIGELPAHTDPDQLAFQLASLLAGANLTYVLHDDPALLARARQAVRALLASPDRTLRDPL